MRVITSKSKNAESFYISKGYVNDKGVSTSVIVRKLGTLKELLPEHGPTRDDVMAWAKEEARLETLKYKQEQEEKQIKLTFHADRQLDYGRQTFYRGGYLFLQSVYYQMQMNKICRKLKQKYMFKYDINAILSDLIYARILEPCSKRSSYKVASEFLESPSYELHDVYRALDVLGAECDMIQAEVYKNSHFLGQRNDKILYYDCSNYYFEIDLPWEDKQKGPSKENRHAPIIGQALLLDADLVPVSMQMYPGNESEKPYIRKTIEEMKNRHKISGKTVQVADKGLNCARNIYAAVKEASDGYIFSKSIHGRNLSEKEKKWVVLENDQNVWVNHTDKNGKLLYRLKSCVDTFSYQFKETDPETGKETVTMFSVTEKRIVSYNPSLAKKQTAEILKMADKASNYTTYKAMTREELGDCAKYIKVTNKDKNGKKIKPVIEIDQEKLEEDLKYAGYNLIVTSELDMDPLQVYQTYHSLWKIEESFRLTKSFLDARPVYVQKKETIYGHFLICYLSLFLLRVLEIKVFKNKINSYDLIHFIRDFRVVKGGDGSYINISRNQSVNEKVKELTGLTNLDALYLSEKEVENFFQNCILLDS